MLSKSTSEKRKNPRFSVQLPVTIENSNSRLSTMCSNISRGGMYLETSEFIDVGNNLTILVNFPFMDHPAKVRGKVLWKRLTAGKDIYGNNLSGMGVEFLSPLPDSIKLPETDAEEEFGAVDINKIRKTPRIYQ